MPMLMKGETFKDALKLVRGKPRFEYPIIVEAKADEIRCRVYLDGTDTLCFESYAEKPLHNLSWFAGAFRNLFLAYDIRELDVGVLVNGNFNDSYRYVRSSKGLPQEKFDKKTQSVAPALDESMVRFIVFDIPACQNTYLIRQAALRVMTDFLRRQGLDAIRPVHVTCDTEAEVWAVYQDFREKGYEGAMGKLPNHLYTRARTFDWMKIKPSLDFDGRITGFNEARATVETDTHKIGDGLGRVGSINIVMEDGSTASPAGIPHALGRELWENQEKYIGQWIEAVCMERDRQGGYRHPIYKRFREAKQ